MLAHVYYTSTEMETSSNKFHIATFVVTKCQHCIMPDL